jgi:predicted transcriptional regulator of viral defense system
MTQAFVHTQEDRAVALLARRGAVRSRELTAAGVNPAVLVRLVKKGSVRRLSRGLYALADADAPAEQALAEVAALAPRAVVCLVSALQLHDMTLQTPGRVWIAIGHKDWPPSIAYPPVRIVRMGEKALALGVESHEICGVPVKVFSPAKSIVDCFRFRSAVGLDVAIEALKMGVASGKARPAEIADYAKTLRIWSVLRPYLETVAAENG